MADPERSERILVAAPLGRDGTLMTGVLAEAGYQTQSCASPAELASGIEGGAGLAVVTYEFLDEAALDALGSALRRQPPWSDFLILVFTPGEPSPASEAALERLMALGNIGLLERPIRLATLLSAVASGLRSRRHQYDMRELLRELRDGLLQRDHFLAMLGHELRNPLAAIVTAVEVMELPTSAGSEASARQRGVIRRQGRVLARLVDDLLDVARVTSGKIHLRLDRVDLPDLVRRAVDAVGVQAERRRIDIRCEVAAAAGAATMGDATRLEQVLSNLLSNALKYTPAGGTIDVRLAVEGNQAVMSVSDTGIGIEPEVLPHIFDLFRQADRALNRSAGGLGLGLTLARSLVELHGGSIAAASPGLGRGSTFSVRLNLAEAAAPDADSTPTGTTAVGGPADGLRVFVLEDQDDIREGMAALLEALGCAVDAAADGESGAARIVETRPDAALVDVGLPGIDGYEVARRVRGALGQGIFLAALTGYGQAEDRERARTAGFDVHLTKPVEPSAVQAILARAEGAGRRPPAGAAEARVSRARSRSRR
jgi:signal transduction histidine kinase/FixJ family two-component response regulator